MIATVSLCFLACSACATERFLLGHPELGKRLVRHVLAELDGLALGQPLVLAGPGRQRAFAENGLPVRLVEEQDADLTPPELFARLRHALPGDSASAPWLLLVAPGLGPVTRARVAGLLDHLGKHPARRAVASMTRLPVNSNPAWLDALPDEFLVDGVVTDRTVILPFGQDTSFAAVVEDGQGERPLVQEKPQGSQWLPGLLHFDGALCALSTGARGIPDWRDWDCLAHEPETGGSLFHQLPCFQLDCRQELSWELHGEGLQALFGEEWE